MDAEIPALMDQVQYAKHRGKSKQYINKLVKAVVPVMRGAKITAVRTQRANALRCAGGPGRRRHPRIWVDISDFDGQRWGHHRRARAPGGGPQAGDRRGAGYGWRREWDKANPKGGAVKVAA